MPPGRIVKGGLFWYHRDRSTGGDARGADAADFQDHRPGGGRAQAVGVYQAAGRRGGGGPERDHARARPSHGGRRGADRLGVRAGAGHPAAVFAGGRDGPGSRATLSRGAGGLLHGEGNALPEAVLLGAHRAPAGAAERLRRPGRPGPGGGAGGHGAASKRGRRAAPLSGRDLELLRPCPAPLARLLRRRVGHQPPLAAGAAPGYPGAQPIQGRRATRRWCSSSGPPGR